MCETLLCDQAGINHFVMLSKIGNFEIKLYDVDVFNIVYVR